jgi:hypothetical protein
VEHESITADEHVAHVGAVARPTAGGARADHEIGPTVDHGHVRVERGCLRADLVDTATAIGPVERDHHVETADPSVVPLNRQRANGFGQLPVGSADVFECGRASARMAMMTATVRIGRLCMGRILAAGHTVMPYGRPDSMTEITHRFVETNGLHMHIAEAGAPDAPAVLLCHGFPESWYSWRHQLVALADAGYHA